MSRHHSLVSHPILSFADSLSLEDKILGGDEGREWTAIRKAGIGIASAIIADIGELGTFPSPARILLLAGKGNNAADGLIATRGIAERFPGAVIEVHFIFGERANRPFAEKAFGELSLNLGDRVIQIKASEIKGRYDLMIDGVFGLRFRSPIEPEILQVFDIVNKAQIRFRAAVDVPSGLSEHGAIRADFTYATGIPKEPIFQCPNAGRLRYVPIGLLSDSTPGSHRVLLPGSLLGLASLRPAGSDKRSQGHVILIGGSHGYPGAILMAALAAVRSGAGLVTVFAPEELVPAYAARLPEAMWVGWPVSPDGGLSLEGQHLLESRIEKATALLMGPGMGRAVETQALVTDIVNQAKIPLVLDADALMPEIVRTGKAPRILTPHAGEFARIRGGLTIEALCRAAHATVVLKGPVTEICDGKVHYHSIAGGPVLARGGSGDVLAGLTAGLLAQDPGNLAGAACRAVLWHGLAADSLARKSGQVAVHTTELLDHLSAVLRSPEILDET